MPVFVSSAILSLTNREKVGGLNQHAPLATVPPPSPVWNPDRGAARITRGRVMPSSYDQLQWLRGIGASLALCLVRALRTERVLRRTYQATTEIASHANDAPRNAAAMPVSAVKENATAKASMPSAPSAAPAASTAAVICPRRSPARAASRLRRISCFSMSVALAQNMAGRARKTPPATAP